VRVRSQVTLYLMTLECGVQNKHDFNVHETGPKAAQIINALVTITIPDHWPVLRIHKLPRQHEQVKTLIVTNLRSVAGIGALLMQIRKLAVGKKADTSILEDTLAVLQLVLKGNLFLHTMLKDIRKMYQKETQRRLNWQEVVSLMAGSKILAFVAQAISVGGVSSGKLKWLSEGNEYCKWLAKNVSNMLVELGPHDEEAWIMTTQVFKRALNLGYRGKFHILVASWY
jgi:telomere length regulation protein